MKVAPLYHALRACAWARPILIHTGQHYDENMSGAVLRDLGINAIDHSLGIGSGSHAEQTGRTMIAYEELASKERPDLLVVVGDVNATIACALAGKKLGIELAHLEAGLRSFDRTMPEEINRLATDAISDYFWTPSPDGTERLRLEAVPAERIREVGNIMIDAYCLLEPQIMAHPIVGEMGLVGDYALITMHRPANVDKADNLAKLVRLLGDLAQRLPLVFPMHPRTRKNLQQAGLLAELQANPKISVVEPLSYVPFMRLMRGARLLLTDSGGVQEESSYLGIPCVTLRDNTERPTTVTHGTNCLANMGNVMGLVMKALDEPLPTRPIIPNWDGRTAARITNHIHEICFGVR